MNTITTIHEPGQEQHTLEIAPNTIVPASVIRIGGGVVLLIGSLFLIGAIVVTALVLGSDMLMVGGFFGFTMMMMIGLPLILACLNDALDPSGHEV